MNNSLELYNQKLEVIDGMSKKELTKFNVSDLIQQIKEVCRITNTEYSKEAEYIIILNHFKKLIKEKCEGSDYSGFFCLYHDIFDNQKIFNNCVTKTQQMKIVSLKNKKTFLKRIWWLSDNNIINLSDENYRFIVKFPYPKAILDDLKNRLENSRKVILEEEKTEIKITHTKRRMIIENENNLIDSKIIDTNLINDEIYNEQEISKIKTDFKLDDILINRQLVKELICQYITFNNEVDKVSLIDLPDIFTSKYVNAPLSMKIDFTKFHIYKQKIQMKEKKKNKYYKTKLEKEKKQKEQIKQDKLIEDKINYIKSNSPEEYQQLIKEAEKMVNKNYHLESIINSPEKYKQKLDFYVNIQLYALTKERYL